MIVARATPMQKAQVVDMIKSRDTWNVTLAIGDGANDVAMIQKAHVGVGIKGLEGGQAAAQADFAIGQFKYVKSRSATPVRPHPLLTGIFTVCSSSTGVGTTVAWRFLAATFSTRTPCCRCRCSSTTC